MLDNIMAEADIVRRNLRLMASKGECTMRKLLMKSESLGGGTEVIGGKRYPCIAANFYYDTETGQILCFSNLDERWEGKAAKGTFRIAVDLESRTSSFFKIVTVFFGDRASAAANRVVFQSMNVYNAAR